MRCMVCVRAAVRCVICMGAAVSCMVHVRIAAGDEGAKEEYEGLPQEEQGHRVHQHIDGCLAEPEVDCDSLSALVVCSIASSMDRVLR